MIFCQDIEEMTVQQIPGPAYAIVAEAGRSEDYEESLTARGRKQPFSLRHFFGGDPPHPMTI